VAEKKVVRMRVHGLAWHVVGGARALVYEMHSFSVF
jgi:hypothetical protein